MIREKAADLVVFGKIFTAEKEGNGLCGAFAVKDGKYIYAGDRDGAADYIDEGRTKIIDNTGKGLIIPGCTEGHGHFIGIDAVARMMPGYYMHYDGLLDLIREKMTAEEKPEYFLSWGLDYQIFMEKTGTDRNYAEEIESAAPDIPVVLIDSGGHQALCNQTALKIAGLDNGKKVRGGDIRLTSGGVPNGVISDEVIPYVIERTIDLSKVDAEIYRTACSNAVDTLHERGFTNYYDAYINCMGGPIWYPYLKDMDDSGELGINVTTTYTVRSYEAEEYREKIDYMIEEGNKYRTTHFNPLVLKLFSDGVVEARTGWTIGKYPGAKPGQEHGNIVWSPDELKEIAAYANSKGIPIHTHTFGDGACRAVIDAYINAEEKSGKKLHNTLAHVRNITDEDIRRCAEHDIGIAGNLLWHCMDVSALSQKQRSSKPGFLSKICKSVECWIKLMIIKSYFPRGIFESGYPMKSLVDSGITVSSSTDAPCAEFIKGNIQNIIEVAVTGTAPGDDARPYNPGELLSIREVLNCLTIDGARQLGIDDRCGSVKEGKNADFVILDTDFLDFTGADLRTIHNTKIQNVYFEGKEVYRAEQ